MLYHIESINMVQFAWHCNKSCCGTSCRLVDPHRHKKIIYYYYYCYCCWVLVLLL